MLSVKLLTNPLLTASRVVKGSLAIHRNKIKSSSSLTTLRSKTLSCLYSSFPTQVLQDGQQGALCHSKALRSSSPQVQHPFIPQEGNVQPRRDEAVSEHASQTVRPSGKYLSRFSFFFFFNPTSLLKLPKKQLVPFRELLFPRFTEVRSKAAATQSHAEVPAPAVLAQS